MDETTSDPIEPDPQWSVCAVCWAVVASAAGHAATHAPATPTDGQDDEPPTDTPEEP